MNHLMRKEKLVCDLDKPSEQELVLDPDWPEFDDWAPPDETEVIPEAEEEPEQKDGGFYRDSVTGAPLPPELVDEACREEVDFMDK